jgi:hypothetical protein
MARVTSRYDRYQSIAAFLFYLAFSLLLFGRGLSGRSTTACIGLKSDPIMFMWYLRWWRYALEHRVNPFLTDLLWAPPGFNLAWSTFIPLPAWIVMPLGRAFGETAAYNFLCVIALPLAATAAFLLCRRVTGVFWPSLLGGYIFGFSPFMLGEMLGGHLHLLLAFPIPLAVLSTLRRLDGEISARRFTLEIAALLVVQFLCGIELFATMSIFAGLAMLVALIFFDGETRTRLLGLIAPLAAAYALAMIVVSPYLYYLFALGFPHGPIWSPTKFTGDLLNFFIPTEANLLGTLGFAEAISANFSGDLYENGVYIGIPLLILIEAYRRSAWHTPLGKFLIATLAVAAVASFGPVLRVGGRPLFPMPWALVANLPVVSNAIAARFSMYAALVISPIAAIWFSSASTRTSTKVVAALLVVLFLAPNPSALFWTRPLTLPAFFADETYLRVLQPREVVLPLPYGERGDCMYWQGRTDMYFRMASGWTGITPLEFERMPIVNFLYGETDLPEPGDQLKAFIARFAVTAIVADPSYERFPVFAPALASLGVSAQPVGGVLIYKIAPEKFAAYAKLTGAEVEARALALRFDSILAATAGYLAAENDPLKLSALELQHLNLLPPDWRIATAKNSLIGWSIGGLPDKRIAIALYGFDQGLKPLLDRYSGKVDELLYPAPSRWNPRSSPPEEHREEQSGTALIIFNRTQFDAAVRQLKSSPPPEVTTPFLGADSR